MKGFEPLYQLVTHTQAQAATTQFSPLSLIPGLLSLTPLSLIPQRTASSGISPLDPFVLAPGLHLQLSANELHKAEYPACAALTTGYVFRVENPATVYYLQRASRPGHLTELHVAGPRARCPLRAVRDAAGAIAAASVSVIAARRIFAIGDIWAGVFLGNLVLTRIIHFVGLRRRSVLGWFGAPEPGVQSDILVLLSQDRWVRIKGATDDIKPILSGTWLQEPMVVERFFGAVAKLLSYANVAVAGYATDAGVVTLVSMLLVNSGLLALDGLRVRPLRMYGSTMEQVGEPKKYFRRKALAEELIEETGRKDWAIGLGMIVVKPEETKQAIM